jgi:hypothetical protein
LNNPLPPSIPVTRGGFDYWVHRLVPHPVVNLLYRSGLKGSRKSWLD